VTHVIDNDAGAVDCRSGTTVARQSATERTRRYRERRRAGFHCVAVEISAADIVGLIRLGHLDRLERDDPNAVRDALHALFDATIASG
jgi:hypothetical protein